MMTYMDFATLLLIPLAVARVTRLVTEDRITESIRARLSVRWLTKAGEDSLALYLITCPWCVSIYAGAIAGPVWWAWGESRWLAAVLVALAASYVTGWLASREGE